MVFSILNSARHIITVKFTEKLKTIAHRCAVTFTVAYKKAPGNNPHFKGLWSAARPATMTKLSARDTGAHPKTYLNKNPLGHARQKTEQNNTFENKIAALEEAAKKPGQCTKLGKGVTNTAYLLKIDGTSKELVIKYEQTKRGQANADSLIGIPLNAPNYGVRNLAMARLADALGCPDRVVLSTRVPQEEITATGLPKQNPSGTWIVMERAPGKSARKVFELFSGELKNNGEVLQQSTDLQYLDYLAGNTDRHPDNYHIDFKTAEDGTVTHVRVTGIDNDASFGMNTEKASDIIGLAGLIGGPGQGFTDGRLAHFEKIFEKEGLNDKVTFKDFHGLCKSMALSQNNERLLTTKIEKILTLCFPDPSKRSQQMDNLFAKDANQDLKETIQGFNLPKDKKTELFKALQDWQKKKKNTSNTEQYAKILERFESVDQKHPTPKKSETPQLFEDEWTELEEKALEEKTLRPKKAFEEMFKTLTEQYVDAYGRKDYRGVFLPPVISIEMYTNIMALNETKIRAITEGLEEEEIQATLSRLESLKKHILILDRQNALIKPHEWESQRVRERVFPDTSAHYGSPDGAKTNHSPGYVLATTYMRRDLKTGTA